MAMTEARPGIRIANSDHSGLAPLIATMAAWMSNASGG